MLVAVTLGNTETSLAGEINADEARVIAAAKNTFSYKNKYYVAKESYLQQLRSELSADDVDLSSTEADDAIAEMYGSVKEGIEQGYLRCIGSKTKDLATSQNKDKKDGSQSGQKKEDADTETDADKKDKTEETTGTSEEKTQQEKENENTTDATVGTQVVEIEETSNNLPELMSIKEQQLSDNDVSLEVSEKAVVATGTAIDSENSGSGKSLVMFIVLEIGAVISGFFAYRKYK